jgi:hypothetical protein
MLQCRNTKPEAEIKGALMQTKVCRASCGAKNQHQFSRTGKQKRKQQYPWQSITSQLRQSAEAKGAARPQPPRIEPPMK